MHIEETEVFPVQNAVAWRHEIRLCGFLGRLRRIFQAGKLNPRISTPHYRRNAEYHEVKVVLRQCNATILTISIMCCP